MASTANTSTGAVTAEASRWPQLIFGVACMVAASNIQYSWTQFVPEIQKAHGWERAAIQTAFSIFVVVQTWCTPFVGAMIDRLGPRALVLFRSEEHTSELQSQSNLVCRLLLEKK